MKQVGKCDQQDGTFEAPIVKRAQRESGQQPTRELKPIG